MLATGLYGSQRVSKTTTKEISSSTSLAFTSTLTSLLSQPPPTQTSGRQRPSKSKPNIFTTHNKNAQKRAAKDLDATSRNVRQRHNPNIGAVDDETLQRSRKKLEEKAKKYRAMKRGDVNGDEELVDFDRKWVDGEASDSDDDDSVIDEGQSEIIEYEDEYGRLRHGTRADVDRLKRKKRNQLRGAEELERMSARPAMPSTLIYGDTIQAEAFAPEDTILTKMEELAAKRDKSATPPPEVHYEADKEIRGKGVGFFTFSKDEKVRKEEMERLDHERKETERARREREGMKKERRREIEERRRVIGEKRAQKQADSFLEGLGVDIGGHAARRN
ncbi:hypothetical protein BJ878DRAFT_412023 [Calycina marina]|uniref:Uncharacterized protein n=1 Tax=Calycina marina TaxID=1763456 RepID=A0A9P7ZAY4_9HELO|nr:hypothetical protein BJ878DRAFT_412023 [Calycina marina]